MPYIAHASRPYYDTLVAGIPVATMETGEINYLITKILLATSPKRYEDYNRLIGVIECVKLEMYRRAVASYEDKKIEENGDVY